MREECIDVLRDLGVLGGGFVSLLVCFVARRRVLSVPKACVSLFRRVLRAGSLGDGGVFVWNQVKFGIVVGQVVLRCVWTVYREGGCA